MRPVTDWCKHIAIFFGDDGQYVGDKKLKYSEVNFAYKGRMFNFLPDESSRFRRGFFITSKKYYFYNINNPMPLILNKTVEPLVNSEAYRNIIETDIIKKINALGKSNFFTWLMQPKIMMLVIVIVIALYYFSKKGVGLG